MTIPTQMSLQGYIATTPELTFTGKGHPRLFCRVGIEQHRKEVDGSFTKLAPVYCDLVLFDRAAERAYPRFKPGDQIVASGYIHEYERQTVESVFDTFKGQLDLEHHHGKTISGIYTRIAQRVLALTAVIWHNDRAGAPVLRSLTAYDHRRPGINHLGDGIDGGTAGLVRDAAVHHVQDPVAALGDARIVCCNQYRTAALCELQQQGHHGGAVGHVKSCRWLIR